MFLTDLPPTPVPAATLVVTASRTPEQRGNSPASIAFIPDRQLERLGTPLLSDIVRLTPSAAVATSGPAGSQAQVRIRGAEANHTLLFIDGIRANDPAAGNEPRFELLNADLADRIEIVRGPQSALWGSEAIGGVVALRAAPFEGASGLVEGGSHGFGRASARAGLQQGGFDLGLAAGVQGADGINAFAGGPGDRDGYRNGAVRGRLDWRHDGGLTLSASGFALRARSEFDGFDPVTFLRADTDESSRNRLQAGRLGARYLANGWTLGFGVSRLTSANRNLLGSAEQNRTAGKRDTVQGEVGRGFVTRGLIHRLTAAAEWTRERFDASDTSFGGFTNQARRRDQSALVGEWRGESGPGVLTLALRRDDFSDFRNATTARIGALVRVGQGWQLAGSYGSGIAQPSFFDLYGFFPGSFVGNQALKPERSRGAEIALRRTDGHWRGGLTLYRQRLDSEIVERFDAATFLSSVINTPGRSRRQGVELEAAYVPSNALAVTAHYAYLDATEPAGRELRRPRHSGALVVDGKAGRFVYGASLAYAGRRLDRDFDSFPSRLVALKADWSLGGRAAYRLSDTIELFGRIANALALERTDLVGYRLEGRTAYAGIRLGLDR